MEPEMIVDCRCATGENPLWHPDEKRLYWVDIPRGQLFRYDPATGGHELCYQEGVIGGFTIQQDGALLLFMGGGAVRTWREGQTRTVIEEIPRERNSRFNDVIADPEGRVYCGTMSTRDQLGRLYRLDPDGTFSVVLEDVGNSNGMGFTTDRRHMYHTDTLDDTIYVHDYDRASGELSGRKAFARCGEGPGRPDGMTVDAQDGVWSALWDGSCVVRFSPEGQELERIGFPARKVSSVIFGGDDSSDMYVTTAGGGNREQEGEGAGGLFQVRPGVRGGAEFRSRIGL